MSGVEVYQLRYTGRSAAWFEVDATNYADFAHSASIYEYRTLYSQATVDTLRAQIEAAEAEISTRREDYAEGRRIDAIYPTDINGDTPPSTEGGED